MINYAKIIIKTKKLLTLIYFFKGKIMKINHKSSIRNLIPIVSILTPITSTNLFAENYVVKLFDSNNSKGIWQMIGTLGLKDQSATSSSNSDINNSSEDLVSPTIPDSDTGTVTTSSTSDTNISVLYPESGESESELSITSLFDVDLSNSVFDPITISNGELVLYGYDTNATTDKWLYFNSKSSTEANKLSTIKKGVGYWARFDSPNSSSSSLTSNSGFIFDDNFNIGASTYTGKIYSGWNLLSIPEMRTTEGVYITALSLNNLSDNNLTISYRDDVEKYKINLALHNSVLTNVSKINQAISNARIYAFQSSSPSGFIILMSEKPFTISSTSTLVNYDLVEKQYESYLIGTKISSVYLYGKLLDMNEKIISLISPINLSLNGVSTNIDFLDPTSSYSASIPVSTIGFTTYKVVRNFGTVDQNYTLALSKDSFYIEDKNYIKTYSTRNINPANYIIDDTNPLIMYALSDKRNEVDTSFELIGNERVIKQVGDPVDFLRSASYSDLTSSGIITSDLALSSRYIQSYKFPIKDSLKHFMASVFSGYLPSQILTLKNEQNENIKWDSLPISKKLTTWSNFASDYDLIHSINRNKSYWVKFDPYISGVKFSIDINGTEKATNIIHIVSDDNQTISNLVHYTLQIPTINLSRSARGYINIGSHKIELKPELDGSIFSAEINSEDLSGLENSSTATIYIIDEDGYSAKSTISLDFIKPITPSSSTKLETVALDTSLRVFRNELRLFDEVTNLDTGLCKDFGISKVYIVKTNSLDKNTSIGSLILSDPIEKTHISYLKGTSRLTTSTADYVTKPIKYNESCEKISDIPVATEGITVGISSSTMNLYYKKSTTYASASPDFPKVIYVKSGSNPVLEIKFSPAYINQFFYIVDQNNKVYSGQFVADIYGNNQNPLYLQPIE